jgi:hypothetical protein
MATREIVGGWWLVVGVGGSWLVRDVRRGEAGVALCGS